MSSHMNFATYHAYTPWIVQELDCWPNFQTFVTGEMFFLSVRKKIIKIVTKYILMRNKTTLTFWVTLISSLLVSKLYVTMYHIKILYKYLIFYMWV